MIKLSLISLLLVCSTTACQTTSPIHLQNTSPPLINTANAKSQTNHSASGIFEYREMSQVEDVNIYQVARRFLWDYEPADVDPEPYLTQLSASYPIRRYEITFYGSNAEQVDAALKAWIERFKQHGGV